MAARGQCAERHLIVGGKDRAWLAGKQACRRGQAAGVGEVAVIDQVGIETGRGHAFLETGEALARRAHAEHAPDKRDALVAKA